MRGLREVSLEDRSYLRPLRIPVEEPRRPTEQSDYEDEELVTLKIDCSRSLCQRISLAHKSRHFSLPNPAK